MNCFILSCLAVTLAVVAGDELSLKLHLSSQWDSFKSANAKTYASSAEEDKRKDIFKENVQKVLENNLAVDLGKKGHKLGVNQFSDMTLKEFADKMLGLRYNKTVSEDDAPTVVQDSNGPTLSSAPASRDWRGYMTPITNQGECGSCWTFATTGAVEGHLAIYKNQRVKLSEQNLLDCASAYGNHGCQGGFPDYAFQYIIGNGGIDSANCYRYEGMEGYCRYNPACRAATIRGFVDIPSRNERAMLEAVGNVGPVAIGMDAMQEDLKMYAGEIYDSYSCSDTQLNHAVVIVGYGSENGRDYWLVRNSWGTGWGIGGHFKLARGRNRCGYANTASYPVV